MSFQDGLEQKSEEIAKETARAGKKLFAVLINVEADIINLATVIPKQIMSALAKNEKEVFKGKQDIKTLVESGAKLDNIPIDKDKRGDFDSVARKYGIDYSFKKAIGDGGKEQHILFFKAKDINVLTAAFKEFTAKVMQNEHKKSIDKQLKAEKQAERNERNAPDYEKHPKNRERKLEKKKAREDVL